MHGELIEFNERLHRALVAKEALVSQMRQELIDLRGPVSVPQQQAGPSLAICLCPPLLWGSGRPLLPEVSLLGQSSQVPGSVLCLNLYPCGLLVRIFSLLIFACFCPVVWFEGHPI